MSQPWVATDIQGMHVAASRLASAKDVAHDAMRGVRADLDASEAAWSRRTLPAYAAVLARISDDGTAIADAVSQASARITSDANEYAAVEARTRGALRVASEDVPPSEGPSTPLLDI